MLTLEELKQVKSEEVMVSCTQPVYAYFRDKDGSTYREPVVVWSFERVWLEGHIMMTGMRGITVSGKSANQQIEESFIRFSWYEA